MRKHWKELAFLGLLLAGLALGSRAPFTPALSVLGHRVLMVLIWTTGLWILEPFGISFGASSCCMFALLLLAGVPTAAVFSGFTQSSVWTMIPALFFGFALKKTGLGKRISYGLLRRIRRVTYPKLILCWTLIGIILSFLTPSITVRVIMITPLARECAQICGLPRHSRGRSLLLLSAWAMAVIPGIGWTTGSLMGPILTGIFSSVEGIPAVSFSDWSRVMLLPAMLTSLLLLAGGAVVLRPAAPLSVPQSVFLQMYAGVPPMSRHEKITGAVLSACFLLFATGTLHGIPDTAICLFGFFLLCICGVIRPQEISSGISWDIILFVGASMSFGEIFSAAGVSAWLSSVLFPLFGNLVCNPWVFMPVMLCLLFLWRFVDVALLTPTIVVLSAVLPSLWQNYGLHPMAWIPLFCFAICAFFLKYENMFLLLGESELQEDGWSGKDRFRYASVFFLACLVTTCLMIPYWSGLGLFG
ncbi:MAG: SLC13 family permease [Candidatus Avoscillospira sp.]